MWTPHGYLLPPWLLLPCANTEKRGRGSWGGGRRGEAGEKGGAATVAGGGGDRGWRQRSG
uniref:Uncharacterized protein n=1 Tax=Oryza sativa subsp. japonica TaxID=39947 RepID=Q851W3_ORYSJ|nr:hypothetical protein [Oryza sativa Japonica Group]